MVNPNPTSIALTVTRPTKRPRTGKQATIIERIAKRYQEKRILLRPNSGRRLERLRERFTLSEIDSVVLHNRFVRR